MRRLTALFFALAMPLAFAADDKRDQLLEMVKALQNEVQQLRSEIQELKGRAPAPVPPVQPGSRAAAPQPTPVLPPVRPIPSDQNSDPGAGAAGRQRTWASLGITGAGGSERQITGRARLFRAFGSNSQYFAFQSEAEYNYFRDRQEGQFDVGLVARRRYVQLGGFTSFKHVQLEHLQAGGTIGQFAGMLEGILPKHLRVGIFATHSFLDNAVLRTFGSQEFVLKVADQYGISGSVPTPFNGWVDGSISFLQLAQGNESRYNSRAPFQFTESILFDTGQRARHQGYTGRWTVPLRFAPLALSIEGGYNEGLISPQNSWRLGFGVQFHGWPRLRQFSGEATPAPVEVPRIRYEILARNKDLLAGPLANAGASRSGVPGGRVDLDGSASLRAVRYRWTELTSQGAQIADPGKAQTSFTAKAGVTYVFQLEVADARGFRDTATVTISTSGDASITTFFAQPPSILGGEQSALRWETKDAETVTLDSRDSAGNRASFGKVAPSDTLLVSPHSTTTYTLSVQTGSGAAVTRSVTITVGAAKPTIDSFVAASNTIPAGGQVNLVWSTTGARTVTLDGKPVATSGSQTVTINADTVFTLVASNGNPADDVKAIVTVRVSLPRAPLIANFSATQVVLFAGDSAEIHWAVARADSVTITGIGPVPASGSQKTPVNATTTFTLTATNRGGTSTASLTITVRGAPAIQSFSAQPSTITQRNGSATLTWCTTNAEDVTISSIGRVSGCGSIVVSPQYDTAYVLVASSGGGQKSVSQSITVLVRYPPFGGP